MEKNAWTKDLSLGLPDLDAQHKGIIQTIADIEVLESAAANKNKLLKLVKKLNSEIAAHFSAEEKYMDNSLYPDTTGHKVLHGEFMEEVEDMEARALHGETGKKFVSDFKENVGDWFILHIRKNDVKLASYIVKK